MADFKIALTSLLAFSVGDAEACVSGIMARYKNFPSLALADVDELSRIPGMDADKALLIKLAYSLASRREIDKFKIGTAHSEEEILSYLKAFFFNLPNETVHAIMLDAKGRVTHSAVVSEGTVNTSAILPRKILELAVTYGAKSVILSHNHPLGYATPSVEDIETTTALKRLLESSGRTLSAHYVIANDGYYKIDINS